jgi:hypothetical protein
MSLTAYVRYDNTGRIVPGGPIVTSIKPKVGDWVAVDDVLTTVPNYKLRGFIRYIKNGNYVAGSLILQHNEPQDGNWKEVYVLNPACCATTTTTTSSSTSTTTTTTSTSSTSTTTSTSTTIPPPVIYYYNVTGYSCGTPCNNVGPFTAQSTTPLTIGYFYNNPENRGYSFEVLEEISAVLGAYDLTGEPGYETCTDACP